jgi:hypothetical protein
MAKGDGRKRRRATFAIAPPQSETYWNAVGIFPQAIHRKADQKGLRKDAHDQVRGLAASDLKTLLRVAGLSIDDNAAATDLATSVLLQCDDDSLVFLREFLRRRSDAIRRSYDAIVPSRIRASAGQLKPFARLLALYCHDVTSLKEIFFLHLWQSNRTSFALDSDQPLPSSIRREIEKDSKALADTVSKAWSGRDVEFFGTHELNDGTSVVVFNREYSPSIQRDFRSRFNLHFRCGFVVFGFSGDRKAMLVKCGNTRIAEAIRFYFQGTYSVRFVNRQTQIFSTFDPTELATRFLGNISADSALTIVAARFRRSSLPSHSPLSLSEPGRHISIHQDLRQLSDGQAVALAAFDELAQLIVDFQGRPAEIDFIRLPGGAIRLRLNDTGWNSEALDELGTAFQSSFGVPLDRSIDPRRLTLGPSRIVSFLLNTTSESDVQDYHRDQLKRLVKQGLVEHTSRQVRMCTNAICRMKVEVTDPTTETCTACDQPLHEAKVKEIARSSRGITTFVGGILNSSTGWTLQKERQFEGHKYHPLLSGHTGRADEVAVLLRDRLPTSVKTTFQRSTLPVILIHTTSTERDIYYGPDNIGYINLAQLFVAQQDADEKVASDDRCRNLLRSLLVHFKERIATASGHSYEHLKSGTAADPGHVYETDVFNVLRAVFGYSYQLGREGRAEPDGYVCNPVYGEGGSRTLDKVDSWNWTYDAKHSNAAAGYDLSIGERRKMAEYINAIRRKPHFLGENRRLRAHVIISNNMRDAAMQRAADYLFGPDGLKKQNRDVRLVLMREGFVTRLYELFAEKHEQLQRRLPLLGEFVVNLMDVDNDTKFVALDESNAEDLVNRLVACPEVEATLTYEELISGLDA